eukprot:g2842.t1
MKKVRKNQVSEHLKGIIRSERMRAGGGSLYLDMQTMLKGHCICLEEFVCKRTFSSSLTLCGSQTKKIDARTTDDDLSMFRSLAKELVDYQTKNKDEDEVGVIKWSRHLKHENPTHSKTFANVIRMFEEYFDLEIHATRLNLYLNGDQWKPFHHDSHAYANRGKEDFTVGASFGSSRSLAWRHAKDHSVTFPFPQRNGDVFAFDSDVNKLFQHGVPRGKRSSGPRFSIIAWGRRRHINERNGGELGCKPVNNMMMIRNLSTKDEDAEKKMKENRTSNELLKIKSRTRPMKTNESVEVDLMSIVDEFCARFEKKQKKKNRRVAPAENRKSKKNFKSRNAQLLKELKRDLSADQFKAFKSSAKSFQAEKISASEFVSFCLDEINLHRDILVKALRVLPDVEKKEKALSILGL